MSIDLLHEWCPFLYHSGIELQDFPIRMIYSLLLGSAIGYVRQVRYRSAGLRTFALIMMGSTLATLCSYYIPFLFGSGDPSRVAAQIVSGVGFLGAGAILRGRGASVQGLTTAALVWAAAALGIAVGSGLYMTSLLITVLFVFVVDRMQVIKLKHHLELEDVLISVLFGTTSPDIEALREILQRQDMILAYYTFETRFEEGICRVILHVKAPEKVDMMELSRRISALSKVKVAHIDR